MNKTVKLAALYKYSVLFLRRLISDTLAHQYHNRQEASDTANREVPGTGLDLVPVSLLHDHNIVVGPDAWQRFFYFVGNIFGA